MAKFPLLRFFFFLFQVVKSVKTFEKKISLAIGDGANDVSMIQEAHGM